MPPEPGTERIERTLATARAGEPPRRSWRSLHGLGPLAGLVILCIAATLLNRDFATVDNLMNVLTRTAFIGVIAVGMCFVIISGGIDLSVGSMAALIAGAVILLMNALG
jgi:ribose transport system permease protein